MPKRRKLTGLPIVPELTGKLPKTWGLLDMKQLAAYVGRHPQVLRRHYADGALPEPKHRINHYDADGNHIKTTRRFTLQEAENLKQLFDTMEWGKLAKVRNRSQQRKAKRK